MTFLEYAWAAGVTLALLAVVGGAASWGVGLRGLWAVGAAPAFAVTIVAGAAVVGPWLRMDWSVLPVLVVTIVIVGAIRLVRRRTTADSAPRQRARADPWLILSLLAAALVIGLRIVQIIGAPDHISQTFDNVFHLNGVRFVLDSGNASSLHLGKMTSPGGGVPFYPAAWHALTALVVQLAGVPITVAVNAVVTVVSAVVWPLSIMLLTRTLFGGSSVLAVAVAALAASVPAFPVLLMDYGVLYPFQLGLAILPVALASTLRVLGLVAREEPAGAGWWVLILLGVLPGLALAHPGGFVAWLALSLPMVIVFAWQRFASTRTVIGRVAVIGGFLAYLLVGVLATKVLRPPLDARLWPIQMSVPEAVWQVLSVSMWYLAPAVVAAVAVIAGLIWSVIRPTVPSTIAATMYLLAAILFVAVASMTWGNLRDALTGSWYNNLPRLAAVLVTPVVVVGAYGIERTLAGLSRRISLPRRRQRIALAAIAALALVSLSQLGGMPRAVEWASASYRLDASSPLLTADEYALLLRIPETVPEGVVIAGSPWTGASLAYAIADRPVLMPHTLMEVSDELEAINDGLNTATDDGTTCRAVEDLDVGFVLDFGSAEVHPGTHPFPGLEGLADSEAVRLVDSEGKARLYEVVACGP
ncbi:MAG: DUF6541 family protein [Humibacter sp.]